MTEKNMSQKIKKHNKFFSPGHTACAGCGQTIAIHNITRVLGPNVVIVNATGCSEVYSSRQNQSSWGVPWVHSLFENASSVASGVLAALKKRGDKKTRVVAMGGDGATFDIGLGLLSGMWERGEDILYICLDNEAYMNTGVQGSGATPFGADTTTTPAGKKIPGNNLRKKNMIEIALAHGLNYVATSTSGYPLDIQAKVKKAWEFPGPKYLQILVPCVPGWGYAENLSVELGRLAQQAGLYPVLEFQNGQLVNKMTVGKTPKSVEEYLRPQKRFKHLFLPENRAVLNEVRNIAKRNMEKYGLST